MKFTAIQPGNSTETLNFCCQQWISAANEAIAKRGRFYVALSGGSTPKAIFESLAKQNPSINWSAVFVYWSDERAVSPTDPESNYKMAMDHGFSSFPIPKEQISRMKGELAPKLAAAEYEKILPDQLDLVMLGMGTDGHIASLFPFTEALKSKGRRATENYVPKLNSWRLTLTLDYLNHARSTVVYLFGSEKKKTFQAITESGSSLETYPILGLQSPTIIFDC